MKICKISLISLIAVFSINMPADARVNVKSTNRPTKADAYNQIAQIQYQQQYAAQNAVTANTAESLPVVVEDKTLAESILNNTSETIDVADLEACSMVYPNGTFKWAVPESGIRQNQSAQCVAVIELRDATSGTVLATTTLAAGDMMKCNIDSFPQSGWLSSLESVILPADEAPTLQQVESIMNEEQKQNAGFKIAAGAIVAGLAGNILAPKDTGNDKLFGTNPTALTSTAISAAAGAGLMAASTYSGKVAGDTIKSTAVNAASGMVIGNMMAGAEGGESVLNVVKCKPKGGNESDCVVGVVTQKTGKTFMEDYTKKQKSVYVHSTSHNVFVCDEKGKNCGSETSKFIGINVEATYGEQIPLVNMTQEQNQRVARYKYASDDPKALVSAESGTGDDIFYKVTDAVLTDGSRTHAYAVCSQKVPAKATWNGTNNPVKSFCSEYYFRDTATGAADTQINETNKELYEFEPSTRDASDGGLIDLTNQGRIKGTLTGTAVGGALGGFAGYQGAQDEVTQRWLSEQRTYTDSLSNFYCATGNRFLAQYNSYAEIPEYKKESE